MKVMVSLIISLLVIESHHKKLALLFEVPKVCTLPVQPSLRLK